MPLPDSIDTSATKWVGGPGAQKQQEAASKDAREASAEERARGTAAREAARFQWEQKKHDEENNVGIPPDLMHLTGPDFLAKLPPNEQSQVKALAEGRMAFPAGKAAASPYWQQRVAQVSQYDPTFDAINYNARAATRRDFTSGTSSKNIKALNTALGHLGQLGSQIDGTASHGGFPFATTVNKVENAVRRGYGDSGITKFEQTAGALAGELTQVFRGTGGAEADIQRFLGELNSDGSQEQKGNAVANIAVLLKSRLDALEDQYTKGMGTSSQPLETLDPHAKQVLRSYVPGYEADDRRAAGLTPWQQDTGGNNGAPPLAGGGADKKSIPIPDAMQAEYQSYVAEHRGKLDPDAYAAMRAGLNEKYGFGRESVEAYRDEAKLFNEAAAKGANLNLKIPPAEAKTTGLDKLNASLFNNPVGAAALGAGSMGGAADEVWGTGKALLTGGDVGSNIAGMNAMRQASADQYPIATLGGNVAGALATGYAAGGIPLLAGATQSGVGTAALGAGYGGVTGALENNDNRLGGAITGAALGTAGGLAGKYGLAPLAETIGRSSTGQKIADLADATLTKYRGRGLDRLPVPDITPADKAVLGVNPDIAQVRANLSDAADLGLPYALADADPKLRMLGGAVTRKSIDARDLAERTFDPRARGQADRAVEGIDKHLAPITDIKQRGADLLKAGDQAASPSYTMAMDRAGPVDPHIDAMLQTPAGREALNRARTIAANDGRDPTALGFDLNDQGEVILKSAPSFEMLQLVKRGLDSHVEDFRDPLTQQLNLRGNPMAQSVDDLRKRFVGRLGVINPDYAAGNAEWARYAQRKDALDLGHDVLPKGTLPTRDFQAGLDRAAEYDAGLAPELSDHVTLPELQRGYATSMADAVDRQRLSRDPYDAIYGSTSQQGKVSAIFPEGAPQFDRQYNLERDMTKTRNETLGGPPTAGRLQADEQINGGLGEIATNAAGQVLTGGGAPGLGTMYGLAKRYLGDGMKLGVGKAGRRKAEQIAPILFDINDPRTLVQILDDLAAKKAQQDARDALYEKYGTLLGATALPGVAIGP